MATNTLLTPSALQDKHSRQRSLSNSNTIASSIGASSAGVKAWDQTTVAPSLVEVDAEAALRPDPGTEAEFEVKGENPFAFSPGQLNKLLNPKSLQAFRALGGLRGITKGLQTDISTGLSADETSVSTKISFNDAVHTYKDNKEVSHTSADRNHNTSSDKHFIDRIRVFGKNSLPPKKPNPI
jgi:P-type Ca2+ transporter type 2C